MAECHRLGHSYPVTAVVARENILNPLVTPRQQPSAQTRRILGLFFAAWLNMVLTPCAMAFGGEPQRDCPHCPSNGSQELQSQNLDISRDKQLQPALCETDASQCGIFDDYNHDGRTPEAKMKDAPGSSPILVVPPVTEVAVASVLPEFRFDDASYQTGAPPALNVLYCVYLD